MNKLLTVAIPCYNSHDYMRHAIDSLLPGKDKIEIIIVNDGSSDDTAAIGAEYENLYPDTVRVINKENGGHGDAVMTGLREATGLYFRVLDSDDWVDEEALLKLLDVLDLMNASDTPVDLVITNYVYEKVCEHKSCSINYRKTLPTNRIFGWNEVGKFGTGSYILMHAATYRTDLIRNCGMELPKHTFYVDNIYVSYPMIDVETMYYLDVDLYRYYIGRADQSINESVMISRIDQQLKVNRIMLYDMDINRIENDKKRDYLQYYVEIITLATVALYLRIGTTEAEETAEAFLDEIKAHNPVMYERIISRPFYRHPIRPLRALSRHISYPLYRATYVALRKHFGFN